MQEYTVKVYEDRTEWYHNGLLHRLNGPAIEYANGNKYWYHNGLLHREDGPASEWNDGCKEWYQNGLKHRVDGPAIDYANGWKRWYLNGNELTEADFNAKVNSKPICDGKEVVIDGVKYRLTQVK